MKIIGKRAGLQMSLAIDHRSRTEPGRIQVTTAKVSEDGAHLVLEHPGWPTDFFTGIVLEMSWVPARGTFLAQTHELDGPLRIRGTAARIDGRYVGHRYDPQVVTRETAPGGPRSAVPKGLSETDWVLTALQILGYLDAEGRAVLAEDALERNMVAEIAYPRDHPPDQPCRRAAHPFRPGQPGHRFPSTHGESLSIRQCRGEPR